MAIELEASEKNFITLCLTSGFKLAEGENGKPFDPFLVIIDVNSNESTHVLVADDLNQALDQATNVISRVKEKIIFYGLVWDGYVTSDGVKSDCILVEFGAKSNAQSANVFLYRYSTLEDGKIQPEGKITYSNSADNRIYAEPRFGSMLLSEWEVCVRSPFVVFYLVAAADGTVDEKEFKAFISTLTEASGIESQSLKVAFEHGIQAYSRQLEFLNTQFDPMAELARTREIIAEHAQDNGVAFCEGLYSLGEKVAKSSGGILSFNSVSKSEKEALSNIKIALSL